MLREHECAGHPVGYEARIWSAAYRSGPALSSASAGERTSASGSKPQVEFHITCSSRASPSVTQVPLNIAHASPRLQSSQHRTLLTPYSADSAKQERGINLLLICRRHGLPQRLVRRQVLWRHVELEHLPPELLQQCRRRRVSYHQTVAAGTERYGTQTAQHMLREQRLSARYVAYESFVASLLWQDL